MDIIHDALRELSILRVIVKFEDGFVSVDRNRLAEIGYTLAFESNEPVFRRISDIQRFLYNTTMYLDDRIPIASLKSYKIIELKANYSSF